MLEQREVLIKRNSDVFKKIIEFSTSDPWELRLMNISGGDIEYSTNSSDLFECLSILRTQYLEKNNYFILCNGARINVFPSRMSRQMSGGRKAYINKLGHAAKREDLVDIFDPLEDNSCVATVEEQKKFNVEWMDSLG